MRFTLYLGIVIALANAAVEKLNTNKDDTKKNRAEEQACVALNRLMTFHGQYTNTLTSDSCEGINIYYNDR